MTLIDLGRTASLDARTSPTHPFVRRIKLGPYTTDATLLSTFPGLDESGRPTISVIGVRDLDGGVFIEQPDLAGAEALQQSYYWDNAAQTLYLHLPPSDNPISTTYLYGQAQGFSQGRPVYVDNIEYAPLVKSAPAVRQQQDIQQYDKLSFITGTVALSNNDGRLDDLRTAPVYGNDVIIQYLDDTGGDDFTGSDTTKIATLFVEDYDISLNEVSLRVQDRRKSQNASIPTDRFTSTDYPDGGDVIGEIVPVLWGTPRAIPALVTNGDDETGNVKYRAALTLDAIGTVQVDIDDVWTTVATDSVNLATGEFELTAANGRKDGTSPGQPLDARLVAPTGIVITRLTDIIKDANERFLGVVYNSSNYDTTEWEAEEAAIENGAYYIDDDMELLDLVEEVQNGANVGFRYEIAADGRRTIRVDDEDRTPLYSSTPVSNIRIQNRDKLNVTTDSSVIVAEAVVKYNLDYSTNRYQRLVDDDSLADVLEIYNQRPRQEYETLLTSATDAQERATFARARFDRVRGIVEVVLMGKEYLTLRIYDILYIEITPDEITQQRRPFYGTWKCKIISVAPDTTDATNTIEAVLIPEE